MFVPPPRSYLAKGETCLICTRLHWAALIKTITTAALMMLLTITLGVTVILAAPENWELQVTLLILTLAYVGYLLYVVVHWREDHILITDQRFIRVSGIITPVADDMKLSTITDMTYSRPPLGRILGYGTFRIESPGQKQSMERITYVANPVVMYRVVQARRANLTGQVATV